MNGRVDIQGDDISASKVQATVLGGDVTLSEPHRRGELTPQAAATVVMQTALRLATVILYLKMIP